MEEIERLAILQTLKKTQGDKELAARLLGIGLATLYRRLKEMELKEARSRGSPDMSNPSFLDPDPCR